MDTEPPAVVASVRDLQMRYGDTDVLTRKAARHHVNTE